ncbi:flagellar basal body rod protein FlgB [Afifella sp. IM 167]|uniref:flagellar basal body rod protein FlgB n=1 Tax=Afifella sp. IM 167 TaxID=2033586 RepID=UPI001CCC178E|nr:flagellar basal body rod protein FlgB [Afifella sp. IM 167]MBZ8131786.1 flagellar basal body rod protein FlgB [Afifella sp. IM 167]
MQPVHLFDLAARHAQWASIRQTVISGNVANANTPGFAARDVEPFETVLDSTHLVMAKTQANHLDISGAAAGTSPDVQRDTWNVHYSGNSVSLDEEMVKAGEVNRAFMLNTSVVKSFHRMLLSSMKSGS